MRIGVPKETQPGEHRVAVTPETAKKLIQSGHHVFIESAAGLRASHPDESYEAAGAKILTSFHRESMTEAGIA